MASPDDQKWNSGFTALHYAVLSERYDICDFLIKAGCNPWLPTTASVTATDYALTLVLGRRERNNNTEAFREIFKLSEVVRTRGYSMIHEIVLGLRSDQTLEHALLENAEMIDQLDASSRTALSWAVQRNDIEATKLLLTFNSDPNISDNANMTPLHYATYAEEETCLELLLRHGVHVELRDRDHGWVPLHYAAYLHDNDRTIDLLLNHGSNVNNPRTSFKSALVLAILKNHWKVTARLLQSKPDLYLADNSGWVPLNSAIASQSVECLELLVDAGIDLSQTCWGTESILHLLAAYPQMEAMLCVQRGCLTGVSIYALNKDGLTASAILQQRQPSTAVREAFRNVLRNVHADNDAFKDRISEIRVEVHEVEEDMLDAPVAIIV